MVQPAVAFAFCFCYPGRKPKSFWHLSSQESSINAITQAKAICFLVINEQTFAKINIIHSILLSSLLTLMTCGGALSKEEAVNCFISLHCFCVSVSYKTLAGVR